MNISLISILFSVAMLNIFGSVNSRQNADNSEGQKTKTLIVYITRTKNTEVLAKIIQGYTGGTLIGIETKNPYPTDYQKHVDQVAKENENGFMPPLNTKIDVIEKYDTIFVGFPTWGMEIPPPMKTFLKENNFKGKTIIPFNTNAGYGLGKSIKTIQTLCPESNILKPFSVEGGKERDGVLFVMKGSKEVEVRNKVKVWLSQIGFNLP